jgi:biopolymer transport protein ExbB
MPVWFTRLLELPWETIQLLQAGGKIMVPIAALSLWMWFLILFKLSELRTARRERLLFKHCDSLQPGLADAPEEGWIGKLLREFQERRNHERDCDSKLLESLLQRKVFELERHVPTILMLASVAPLLGLLGTVTGMIATFDAISQVGTGNPRPLAAGISEALITTEFGLAVAIPGLILGGYLRRRVERFRSRLEALRFRLTQILEIEPIQLPQPSGDAN